MDKSTLLRELNSITARLIEKYKPEKNGRQILDYRVKNRRDKWINF